MKKAVWIPIVVAVVAAGILAAVFLPGILRDNRTQSLMQQGEEAENLGDYDAALACYSQILESIPDHAEALSRTAAIRRTNGNRALEEGRFDLAVEEFEKLVALSESEDSLYLLAQSYAACGDKDNTLRVVSDLSEKYGTEPETVIGELFDIQTELEPTCRESGIVLYRSRLGNGSFQDSVPPTGEHCWEEGVLTVSPTCVEEGTLLYTCSICGETRTESVPPTGVHSFTETVTREATCSEEGIRTKICSVCSLEITETIPPTGKHTWKETVTKAPTCVEEGSKSKECTVCGKIEKVSISPTGNHQWKETVLEKPTCAKAGILLKTCSVCGLEQKETLPVTEDHAWAATVPRNPTCADPGDKTVSCPVCGKSYKEVIPATGNHSWKETVTRQPDCSHEGLKTLTCSVCGKVEQTSLPPTGTHSFGEWKVSIPATVSSEGLRKRTCSVCGYEETQPIPKTPVSGSLQELPSTSYYGYTCLKKKGASYVNAYLAIVDCVSRMGEEADIRDFNIPKTDAGLLFECLERDYPQFFWLEKKYGYRFTTDGYLTAFSPSYLCSSAEKKQLQTRFDQAVDALLSGLGSNMSAYELALEIHERIVNGARYDSSLNAPFTHSAYGNLVNKTSVCEGYSKGFQYLMYRCGICATIVTGTANGSPHAWNVVWLDGVPYEVDCTFDDPVLSSGESSPTHEYFCQTTAYLESTGRQMDSTFLPRVTCSNTSLNYYVQNKTSVSLTASSLAEVFLRYSGSAVSIEVLLDRSYSMSAIAAFLDSSIDEIVGERFTSSPTGYSYLYSLSNSGRVLKLNVK